MPRLHVPGGCYHVILRDPNTGTEDRPHTPKLQQQIERITQLPKPKQRMIMEMLEAVLQQAGRQSA